MRHSRCASAGAAPPRTSSSNSNGSSTVYGAPSLAALRQRARAHRLTRCATGAGSRASGSATSNPVSPWENPYVESFNGRVRDELLNIEEFGSLLEAQVVVEAWRIEYNTYRPHGALGGLTPAEVRAAWTTEHQPALS